MLIAEDEIVDRFQLKSVIVPVKIRSQPYLYRRRHPCGVAVPSSVPTMFHS
jgi:hypothetical protein